MMLSLVRRRLHRCFPSRTTVAWNDRWSCCTTAVAVLAVVGVTTVATVTHTAKEQQQQQHKKKYYYAAAAACEADDDDEPPKQSSSGGFADTFRALLLRRQQTRRHMEATAVQESRIEDRYRMDKHPLGEGAFGKVYRAVDRATGRTTVAVKEIPKALCDGSGAAAAKDDTSFQNEIQALLRVQQENGHPNICGLREHFSSGDFYYLVMDLVDGGELFDHLVERGEAYAEVDAARLIRELASALNFLHGIGIVHGDIKPENLMLSSKDDDTATVQLVDFGCAQLQDDHNSISSSRVPLASVSHTPAYSPPERLRAAAARRRSKRSTTTVLDPSMDMWAVGVILHILLTGCHPFDLEGGAPQSEMDAAILNSRHVDPVLADYTSHLSPAAVAVMRQLLRYDPAERATAYELLQHSWVQGETARTAPMSGSDTRLSAFQAMRSKLQADAFLDMVTFSAAPDSSRTSLLQHAFQRFHDEQTEESSVDGQALSFSNFTTLLADNLKNVYHHKGDVVCEEGDEGDSMYFINSGTIQVSGKDGVPLAKLQPGDFFGEGVLLSPSSRRNATVRCLTPVHLIEVNRACVEEYIASGGGGENIAVHLRESFRARNRQRASAFLRLQRSSGERQVEQGAHIYKEGENGDLLYVLQEGLVATSTKAHKVFEVSPGSMFGEQAIIFDAPRAMTATCVKGPCKMMTIPAEEFLAALAAEPQMKESFLEICFRREFQKVICLTSKMSFPNNERELRRVFDALDKQKSGTLDIDNIRSIVRRIDPDLLEGDIVAVLRALDLCQNGRVSWIEFKRIFGMGAKS